MASRLEVIRTLNIVNSITTSFLKTIKRLQAKQVGWQKSKHKAN
ncbi:hypothetical protein [Campylobacter devanensis]|nr:hypothetical protein [Campylobacter sp. P0227]